MTARLPTHRFHDPLLPQDSECQTIGCRHTNPNACSKHSLRDVCAFVRNDGICLAPRRSWPEQYRKLRMLQESAK
jgi:hypothetical protein